MTKFPREYLKLILLKTVMVILLFAVQSCVYISVKQDSKFNQSQLLRIRFESKEASDLFYLKIKIIDIKNYKGSYIKEDSLMIPFIAFKSHKTFYETEYTNSKIREADTDSNGIITLREVKDLRYERASLVKRSVTLTVKED